MRYTTENTEGYSSEDLENLNRIYEHRIALLDELAESLLRSGVSPQQVADLRQTGDLRCSVCGRVLEVVEEDGETTWIACPVYSTGAPDAGEHSSVRLDHPRE